MHWKWEVRLLAKNEWSEIAINLGRPATGGPDIIVQKLKKPSQKPVGIALELDVDGLVHENSEIFRCQLVGVSVEFTESFVIALGAKRMPPRTSLDVFGPKKLLARQPFASKQVIYVSLKHSTIIESGPWRHVLKGQLSNVLADTALPFVVQSFPLSSIKFAPT